MNIRAREIIIKKRLQLKKKKYSRNDIIKEKEKKRRE